MVRLEKWDEVRRCLELAGQDIKPELDKMLSENDKSWIGLNVTLTNEALDVLPP
jgi:hypothetical protein